MAISYLLQESEQKAKENKVGQAIRELIGGAEAKLNIPRSKTIESSGMSTGAFYTCWKDPAKFRVGQLLRIYDSLRIPESERRFV